MLKIFYKYLKIFAHVEIFKYQRVYKTMNNNKRRITNNNSPNCRMSKKVLLTKQTNEKQWVKKINRNVLKNGVFPLLSHADLKNMWFVLRNTLVGEFITKTVVSEMLFTITTVNDLNKYINTNANNWTKFIIKIRLFYIKTKDFYQILSRVITNFEKIVEIDIQNIIFNQNQMKRISNAIAISLRLKKLVINCTNLSPKYIGDMLSKNTTIEILDLQNNSFNDTDIKYIFAPLLKKKNQSLTAIDLSDNSIYDFGATYIAIYIRQSSLTSLNLSNNVITVNGITTLSDAFGKHSKTLTDVNLDMNYINPDGAKQLELMLKDNNTLKKLSLVDSFIDSAGIKCLANMLHKNTTLIELDLSRNDLDISALIYLSKALQNNTTLTKLVLNDITIHHDRISEFLKKLYQNNTTLKILEFNNKNIIIN